MLLKTGKTLHNVKFLIGFGNFTSSIFATDTDQERLDSSTGLMVGNSVMNRPTRGKKIFFILLVNFILFH